MIRGDTNSGYFYRIYEIIKRPRKRDQNSNLLFETKMYLAEI